MIEHDVMKLSFARYVLVKGTFREHVAVCIYYLAWACCGSTLNDHLSSLYPPQNEVLGGYTVFSLSVIPSFRQHFDIFAE